MKTQNFSKVANMHNERTVYIPKGGMCKSCSKRDADCSHLNFRYMIPLTAPDNNNVVVVKCNEFKKPDVDQILKQSMDQLAEANKSMDISSAESYGQKMQVRAYELEQQLNSEKQKVADLLKVVEEMLPFTSIPDKVIGLEQSYLWDEIIEACKNA